MLMQRGVRVRGLALFPVLALHFETSLPGQEDYNVQVAASCMLLLSPKPYTPAGP